MATTGQDIGGISVTIDANTGPLDAKISAANQAIEGLKSSQVVTFTAEADLGSAKTAASNLKKEVMRLQRTSAEDPIAIRFKFDTSRGAVRQTRESVSKELARQGGIQVGLTAMNGSAKMLVESLGAVVVPVAFVWNGQWAEQPNPTINVNMRGQDFEGGGSAGGGTPGGGAPTGGTPAGGGTPGGAAASPANKAKSEAKTAQQNTNKQKAAAASTTAASAPDAGPAASPAATEPVVSVAPGSPKSKTGICPQCGAEYIRANNGWNRHQQTSQRHKDATKGRIRGQASEPVAGRVINLDPNDARNQEVMASTRIDRGIYPAGSGVGAQRAGVAEQRGLGPDPIDLSKMVPGGINNALMQRYIAAGGDINALIKSHQVKALPGRESDFEEEFTPSSLMPWSRERTSGIDPRTGRMAAGDYARASITHPGEFTEGAATEGGVDRQQMAQIWEMATQMRREAYRESDEFKNIKASKRPVYKTTPGGALEKIGDEWAYSGEHGARIDELRQLADMLDDPTLSDEERSLIEEVVISTGFNLGGKQRTSMDKRAYDRALRKSPDVEPRIGKGSRRYRKLTQTGRKGVRNVSSAEDLAVIEVRDIVLDVLQTRENREKDLRTRESTESAMSTKATREALGVTPGRQGKRRKGVTTLATPPQARTGEPAESNQQLKVIDDAINLHKERIATLEEEIKHLGSDTETLESHRASIQQIREEELDPLLMTRAQFMAGLGEPKPKEKLVDPVARRMQLARKMEAATERVRDIKYESSASDLLAERINARRGPTIPQFSAGTTGGAGMPIDRIIEENAKLRSERDAGAAARSERARHAANVRWSRRGAADAGGAGGGDAGGGGAGGGAGVGRAIPVHVVNIAELRSAIGGAGGATGGTVVAAEPIRTRRSRRKAEPRPPGTPRVAGGIDIEAEGGPAPAATGDEESARSPRAPSPAKIQAAIGSDVVEDIQDEVAKNLEKYASISRKARQSGRAIIEENPVRALSVAVGQVLVNLTGRAGLKNRVENLNEESRKFDQSVKRLGQAQVRRRAAEQELREGADLTGPERQIRETEIARLRRVEERRQEVAETRRGRVERGEADLRRGAGLRTVATLGVGSVGIALGTAAFQGTMAAFNLAMEQFSIGMGRVVGRMSDFEQRTGELASSMADATRANYGNVEGIAAGQLAMAGFGDETSNSIRPLVEMRTRVIAGTKAFEEQLDMIRMARNVRGGTVEGAEGDIDARALTTTTGGFPIMNIGGQRPIAELIKNEFSAFTAEQLRLQKQTEMVNQVFGSDQFKTGVPPDAKVDQLRAQIQADLETNAAELGETIGNLNEDAERGGFSPLRMSLGATKKDFDQLRTALAEAIKIYPESSGALTDMVNSMTAAGVKFTGGEVTGQNLLEFLNSVVTGTGLPTADNLARQQSRPLRAQIQGRQMQGEFQRNTVLPAQQFLNQLARPIIPFEETVAARTPGAEDASNFASAKTSIDAAQASLRGYAEQGRAAAEAVVRQADTLTGSNLSGQWQTATQAVASYGKAIAQLEIGMMWKQVNLQVAQYDEQIRVANRSLADAKEFLTGIDAAGNDNLGLLERQSLMYSRQSAQIGFQQQSLGIQSQILGMQNQKLGIRSKELSLQSAQLGRQSQLLGFQSQAMQLAQNQRQINFQQSMAQFAAPGTTPEERAARIEEAKLQADFAQKQQDIAMQQFGIAKEQFALEGVQLGIQAQTLELDKQQFALQQQQVALAQQAYSISVSAYNVQQQIVDLNAARAVQDLSNQLDLLTRARQVTIEIAIDQENLKNMQAAQEAAMAEAQSILEEATDIRQQIINSQVSIASLLGQGVGTYASAVLRALGLGFTQIDEYVRDSLAQYARPSYQGSNFSGFQRYAAEGYYGSVNSPTHMVVGEAGGEQVAILSNPRHMTLGPTSGGSGGGTYIQVNVTGNTVRNDEDLETLASLVAKKVEETMGRRASQLGFRAVR